MVRLAGVAVVRGGVTGHREVQLVRVRVRVTVRVRVRVRVRVVVNPNLR